MPNYIESLLTLQGPSKELERFLEVASGSTVKETQLKDDLNIEQTLFTFESFIPMPSTIFRGDIGTKEQVLYGKNNWYDWRIAHWGTKWDASSIGIEKNLTGKKPYVKVWFQTAWNAVPKVIIKISEMFPELSIKYAYLDEGNNFCGWEKYKAGTLMSDSPNCFKTIRRHLK